MTFVTYNVIYRYHTICSPNSHSAKFPKINPLKISLQYSRQQQVTIYEYTEHQFCVDEQNRSWCSSSRDNDQRAVTIECASDLTEPYAMKPEVYSALVDLCTDICRRNGKRKLVWISDREKALSYEIKADEMLLTVYRWFAKKSCPGNWLMERLGSLADEVNSRLHK